MPIHQVGATVFATCLAHQGTRHGYTGGIPDIGGYGGGLEAGRIAQPHGVFRGREISSRLFPNSWTLWVAARLNFVTIFDPANRRLGEEYLELYPAGKTTAEILTIPIDWYQKGQTRTWSLDLWYARRQEADRVEEIRLSALTFGADNQLGQEIIQNGYLKAKLSTSLIWSPLTVSAGLSLGNFWPNSKKTVDFQFNMPLGALTPVGMNMFRLRIELLRSVVYGSTTYGRAIYGKYEGKKKDVLVKLHVMQ